MLKTISISDLANHQLEPCNRCQNVRKDDLVEGRIIMGLIIGITFWITLFDVFFGDGVTETWQLSVWLLTCLMWVWIK